MDVDDELVVDETIGLEIAGTVQHQTRREDEYSINPGCNKLLKPQIILNNNNDYSQIPNPGYDVTPQGKNLVESPISHVAASEHLRPSEFVDDARDMVEELTVKSYDGLSLDIGTSSNCENAGYLYQLGSDLGVGNSVSDTGFRNSVQGTVNVREDTGSASFPETLARKPHGDDQSNAMKHLTTAEHRAEHNEDVADARRGIRTKMISKSGFAEYFIKNTLKQKGIVCKGPSSNGLRVESREQGSTKGGIGTQMDSKVWLISDSKVAESPHNVIAPRSDGFNCDGVTLREWLKAGRRKRSKAENLSIFRKIVDLVDGFHSHGVALQNLCPSYFKLLPSNRVMYLGLPTQKEILDGGTNSEVLQLDNSLIRKRMSEQVVFPSLDMQSKKQKLNENVRDACDRSQRPPRSDLYHQTTNVVQFSEHNSGRTSSIPDISVAGTLQLKSLNESPEDKWYTSPEGGCTTSSNIYCLGVLFFELLGHFDSERVHVAAMSDLRHRILPPVFLSDNLKEAGFCLLLLHPEPSSRPTTREILQFEVINGVEEVFSEELLLSLDQDGAESELLLRFLNSLEEQKQKESCKLVDDIKCLELDIEEVERRHDLRKSLVPSNLPNGSSCKKESVSLYEDPSSSETLAPVSKVSNSNGLRLTNLYQLESAYFSMRSKIKLPNPKTDSAIHPDKDILKNHENRSMTHTDTEQHKSTDPLGAFFDGLCKYARYSKLEVRGVLRNADFNNPANVICSMSFDRDEDYFATAGISKKIKIFDFNALVNDSVDIHYPVVEMSNRSKLSCICWNNYIKNYLASTDFDGAVKLWDANIGQSFSQFTEHGKRAWSVDFSAVCPTRFASGSDDCSVKLWSTSERNSLSTIRNVANVCCVNFSAHSSHLLAFGSADNSTYCYDLRNLRSPWCVLASHRKAVSYVKFLDSETLVSASTDNTLKIWDLNKASPVGPSTSACSLTLSGHTNAKNFVGLSVADGYIACGSETNEVYAYYRSLPMPVTSHKFGSIDPISGKETDDDNGQFVSSVCWRGKSDMLVAASSSGCIKVLQML